MMVHRVGRTLLIDNLDVYKHVLLAQEVSNFLNVRKLSVSFFTIFAIFDFIVNLFSFQQDWKWLRQFICENLLPPNVDADVTIFLLDKNSFSLINENIFAFSRPFCL